MQMCHVISWQTVMCQTKLFLNGMVSTCKMVSTFLQGVEDEKLA